MDSSDDVSSLKKPGSVFTERRMSMSLRSIQEERSNESLSNFDTTNYDTTMSSENSGGKLLGRKYQRHQAHRSRSRSRSKNRIIDRSRNDYASYLEHHRPSTAQTDKRSVRSYFSTRIDTRFDGPKIDMYRHDRPPTGQFPPVTGYSEQPPQRLETGESEHPAREVSEHRRTAKVFVHVFLALFFTGWWIASLILHKSDKNWIVPFLLWLAIVVRMVTFYVNIEFLMDPFYWIWDKTAPKIKDVTPKKLQLPISALLVAVVVIVGAMATPEFEDNTRLNRAVSLAGLAGFIFLLWGTSRNRRMVDWHTVIVGILMQFIIALFVLRTQAGYDIFNFISELCRSFLGFADTGLAFLTDSSVPTIGWFVVSIVPPIIFFAGIAQLLSYWGVLPWFVRKSAIFFFWALRVSGVEAIVATTSPFLGQGEAVMLIRPFISHITNAELHQIMCSGFATIAGSVLVAYISLGINGQALISSCVMSIPASLVVSKLRYPEEEETFSGQYVVISELNRNNGVNFVHAFTNGVWLGLKIAGIVVSVLASVIALVALVDGLLTWWGGYINIGPETPLTLELMLSYLLYPVAFLLGVPRNGDLLKVARLIGIKILKNEFVAFEALQKDPMYATLSSRSRLIATFSLCGFGNVGAMGTQIGLLSQMAPERSSDIARVAGSALLSGIISTLLSASMAGILITDQAALFSTEALNMTMGNSTIISSVIGG